MSQGQTVNIGYVIGQQITLAMAFAQSNGTLVDPTTITFWLVDPKGARTIYIFGTDPIVKDAIGSYHVVFVPTKSGKHYYGYTGAGAFVDARAGAFEVDRSAFYDGG